MSNGPPVRGTALALGLLLLLEGVIEISAAAGA
jgi:hypothetical protein